MKLYELTKELQELYNQIVEADGEITPEVEKELDTVEGDLATKMESIGNLLRNLDLEASHYAAKADLVKAEAKRLADKEKAIAGRIEAIKGYCVHCLEAAGLSKVKSASYSYSIRQTEKVEADSLEGISEDFIRVKYTEELDKKALLDYWKGLDDKEAHRQIGAAKIVSNKSLQMR
jgi:hypothetical protein